jgi:FtsP/CotA-like multicopper oxidase with cupredoxin domain
MTDVSANNHGRVSRRTMLRIGAAGTAATGLAAAKIVATPDLAHKGWLNRNGLFEAAGVAWSDAVYIENFPTSPLILSPFTDALPIPKAARPVAPTTWKGWAEPPRKGKQSSVDGDTHQKWCDDLPTYTPGQEPIVYQFDLLVRGHSFTSSKVLPIDAAGKPTVSFDETGKQYAAGTERTLPQSTIYGFNGTFPGPMVNAEYGKPVVIRFRNRLDENPWGLDRQDFGSPDWSFLTHLHNAHTAPESDGNPHFTMTKGPKWQGYRPGQWVDNMYLNWPAGNDDREKQSFFWFHDHRMDHTGSNVYKGMVGLYPIYDPKDYAKTGNGPKGAYDAGDERYGLRLPGVRTNNADGSFDVKYDIPLAFYDLALDDGVTAHKDFHDGNGDFPLAGNPRTHPEWWGKSFFKHFPNHGFVGDIFTINGTAYPVLRVKRRKYRLRFLDASIARIYEFKLMSSRKGPVAAKDLGYGGEELQGQYRLTDGQQCMKFTQIASDGGLLPAPVVRDSFELWPAKRREFIVDFTKYQDGTPTTTGDVIYLTNVMKMPNGRMWSNSSRSSIDPNYVVPMMKIIIEEAVTDNSKIPTKMRDLPPLPTNWKSMLDNRKIFEVQRGGAAGEMEWLINGQPFEPYTVTNSLKNPAGNALPASQPKGSFDVWEIRNGGGGWVHPFHLHMEEHRTLMRNNKDVTVTPASTHPEDKSREDLINLDPSESVMIYRGFRDFTGPYVAHCHNLAHEDHAMMFGWEIV